MTMPLTPDSVNMTSSTVPVYETKPGSIIVPGLSGMVLTILVLVG